MGGIVLGMPGPWAEDCREKSDHYTTKIGGLPDWPIPEMGIDPHLLKCGFCGERLCLVAQVYAPVSLPELMIEERVIYILGCSMPKCGRDTRSWRVLRVQKCNVEVQPGSNSPKALSSEENSAPISKITNLWEVDLLTNGSEELDDESDSDVDLQDLCKALSEAASLASRSKKQNGTTHSKGSGKSLVTKPRVTDVAIPVIPCFYIYSQKEPSFGDMVAICANSASHSKKENHGPSPEQEDEEKYEIETYEYDSALCADRTYLKFKKQIDAYPEQCFRYSYGGNPLLATANLVKPEICRLCGSLLHYEIQLMPPLLYFLLNAADGSTYSPEEWNWMTLIVYTCSKGNARRNNLLINGAWSNGLDRNKALFGGRKTKPTIIAQACRALSNEFFMANGANSYVHDTMLWHEEV